MLYDSDVRELKIAMKHGMLFDNVTVQFDLYTMFKRVRTCTVHEIPLNPLVKQFLTWFSWVPAVRKFLRSRVIKTYTYHYVVNPLGLAFIGKFGSPEAGWKFLTKREHIIVIKVNGDENVLLVGGSMYRAAAIYLTRASVISEEDIFRLAEQLQLFATVQDFQAYCNVPASGGFHLASSAIQ